MLFKVGKIFFPEKTVLSVFDISVLIQVLIFGIILTHRVSSNPEFKKLRIALGKVQ